MPRDVDVVLNDRPGNPSIQPSLRNKITDLAKQRRDCEAFVLLHNDVRPARGWFQHLIGDWRDAEKKYGQNRVVMSPRLIPYHKRPPNPTAVRHPAFWQRLHEGKFTDVLSPVEMAAWCKEFGYAFANDEVICPEKSVAADDGHLLMMYAASPHFFDAVGGCDETFVGTGMDDQDWGMRVLMSGRKNLSSRNALVGHIAGFTFGGPGVSRPDNRQIFLAKWGQGFLTSGIAACFGSVFVALEPDVEVKRKVTW